MTYSSTPDPLSGAPASTTPGQATRDVGQQAADAGTRVAQTAKDQGAQVVGETRRQARNLVGEASHQVRRQASGQQRRAVDALRGVADELGSMAGNNTRNGVAGELVGQVSQRAHGVADWLDKREPDEVLDEIRGFARRRPGVFLAAAALAGVVVGRVGRSIASSANQPGSRPTTGTDDLSGYGDQGYTGTAYTEPAGTAYTEPAGTAYTEPAGTAYTGTTGGAYTGSSTDPTVNLSDPEYPAGTGTGTTTGAGYADPGYTGTGTTGRYADDEAYRGTPDPQRRSG